MHLLFPIAFSLTKLHLPFHSTTKKLFPKKIIDLTQNDNAPPDLLGRDFFALEPYKRLVCDITYLTGSDTTWYLSVIEDLFNGEILAWKIGEHCNTKLVIETVEMLKQNVCNLNGCILHSDAGSTYIAYAYRELLLSLGIRQSMGKKLTCFDNARIESFNDVFKNISAEIMLAASHISDYQKEDKDFIKNQHSQFKL